MRFYKYRRQWSGSRGTWEIIRLPEGYTPKEFFSEMAAQSTWSEHFRGIQYRKVSPSKEWLRSEIVRIEKEINALTDLSIDYRVLLNLEE